ncbi:MAG TPA: AraC family transcriptional regulator [Polyangiaceae bacterium]
MTARTPASHEVVDWRRSAEVPGIEVIDAQHSPREWRVICSVHAVVLFRTWRGSVRSRGRLHEGKPGLVFCTPPDEALVANPKQGPGSFSVLEIQAGLLEQCLAEQQPGSVRLDWAAAMQPISERLRSRFLSFFDVFASSASTMHVQSRLLELSELMISELVDKARQPRPFGGPPIKGAARMRECLNEEGLNVDLETLAKRAGLSRFQALRAFKQRYGLPPHAYQLCLRMTQARRVLREGAPAADVAQRCGFSDQSHFTRHFKRFYGVTPMQYARGEAPASESRSGTFFIANDPSAVVDRSDR